MSDKHEINISGLDKAEVLLALFNAARGGGYWPSRSDPMDIEEARKIIAEGDDRDYPGAPQTTYFDYLHGRVMKVDLSGDTLRTHLYDRDNGPGAAERALQEAGLIPA